MAKTNQLGYRRTAIGLTTRADNHSDRGMSSKASLDAKELVYQMITSGLPFYFAQQHVDLPLSIPAASHPLVMMRPFEMVDAANATTATAPRTDCEFEFVAI